MSSHVNSRPEFDRRHEDFSSLARFLCQAGFIALLLSTPLFGQVEYETKTFQATQNGNSFMVRFPVIKSAATAVMKSKLERIIGASNYAKQARDFFKAHDDFIKDIAGLTHLSTADWFSDEATEIIYQSESVLCLKIRSFSYDGGAHPNLYTRYINLRQKTGKEVQLRDIFPDPVKPVLSRLITEQLRKNEGIPDQQKLTDSFFFVDRAEPTENFAITPSGLLFDYNEEISSHSHGPTIVELPYSSLRNLIRPGAPLP